jgi:hypothetical protein
MSAFVQVSDLPRTHVLADSHAFTKLFQTVSMATNSISFERRPRSLDGSIAPLAALVLGPVLPSPAQRTALLCFQPL